VHHGAMAHGNNTVNFKTYLTPTRKPKTPFIKRLKVEMWDRICDFLLINTLQREYIFRSHDEYLDRNETGEVVLPTRLSFPIKFSLANKAIHDTVWRRFSMAMKVKVIQVECVLTRPKGFSPPNDLYCYFIERMDDREFSDDEGVDLSDCNSDHEWQ
jgi:hypothetical protein